MLTFHILNVEQGDSIVIEYESGGEKHYGVIDSNIPDFSDTPPALSKLSLLGAEKLSFVALTHPHLDHFDGLIDILEAYQGKVGTFFAYPLGHEIPGRLDALKEAYKKVCINTESPSLKRNTQELIKLLHHVKKFIGVKNWEEPSGYNNSIYPEGFVGVNVKVLLPHPRDKGPYFQMIEKQDFNIATSEDLNKLSLAFSFHYAGICIVFGGDASAESWLAHKRSLMKGHEKLESNIAKFPHHGSKYNCTEKVIKYLFDIDQNENKKIACISANGREHHPAEEVIDRMENMKIFPYCTNLSDTCRANIKQVQYSENIHPELNRIINQFEEHTGNAIQSCQGDIEIKISDEGEVTVTTQHKNACIYRGDWDFLRV